MLEEHSNRRTFPLDRHAGAAIAGVAADGRAVINRAQSEAAQYKSFYGDPIPGHVLAERIASYMHVFNLYWYVRPFGVCGLLAVYDRDGPQLYLVDPAGTMHRYRGMAVGKGRQGAKNEIEKLKPAEMTCREAVTAIAKMYVSRFFYFIVFYKNRGVIGIFHLCHIESKRISQLKYFFISCWVVCNWVLLALLLLFL